MPVTNKQHAVPQNIMDVEFKLIGDLTMRQFAYLFATGGVAWLAFLTVGGIFKWPLIVVLVLLGLGLAFVPIQDRGLDQWVTNFFKSVYSPTQKVWRKDPNVPAVFTYQDIAVVKQELITLTPTSSRRKLEEYLEHQSSEAGLDKYDLAEKEYIKKVKDAFYDETHALQVPVTLVDQEVPAIAPEMLARPQLAPQLAPPQPVPVQSPKPSPPPTPPSTPTPAPQQQPKMQAAPEPLPPARNVVKSEPLKVLPPLPKAVPAPVPQTPPQIVQQPVPQQPVQRPQENLTINKPKFIASQRHENEDPLSALTPDRHSGRRFMSLLPKQGEIVLPIRGEKIIRTSDQTGIEEDIQQKTKKLQNLIDQIKKNERYADVPKKQEVPKVQPQLQVVPQVQPVKQLPTPIPQPKEPQVELTPPVVGHKDEINRDTQNAIDSIKTENQRLMQEIERLKTEMTSSQTINEQDKQQKEATLQQLEEQKSKTAGDYAAVQQQVKDLQNKIVEKDTAPAPNSVSVASERQSSSGPTSAMTSMPFSNKTNILSGVVKDPAGSVLEGAVVMIKNSENQPKRAIKTNILGQFALANPLANGNYFVEVVHNDKMDYSFDIISITAKGEAIPPLEFIGKK